MPKMYTQKEWELLVYHTFYMPSIPAINPLSAIEINFINDTRARILAHGDIEDYEIDRAIDLLMRPIHLGHRDKEIEFISQLRIDVYTTTLVHDLRAVSGSHVGVSFGSGHCLTTINGGRDFVPASLGDFWRYGLFLLKYTAINGPRMNICDIFPPWSLRKYPHPTVGYLRLAIPLRIAKWMDTFSKWEDMGKLYYRKCQLIEMILTQENIKPHSTYQKVECRYPITNKNDVRMQEYPLHFKGHLASYFYLLRWVPGNVVDYNYCMDALENTLKGGSEVQEPYPGQKPLPKPDRPTMVPVIKVENVDHCCFDGEETVSSKPIDELTKEDFKRYMEADFDGDPVASRDYMNIWTADTPLEKSVIGRDLLEEKIRLNSDYDYNPRLYRNKKAYVHKIERKKINETLGGATAQILGRLSPLFDSEKLKPLSGDASRRSMLTPNPPSNVVNRNKKVRPFKVFSETDRGFFGPYDLEVLERILDSCNTSEAVEGVAKDMRQTQDAAMAAAPEVKRPWLLQGWKFRNT